MKNKPLNVTHSDRNLTQLNKPEVCLEKTIESCLKVVLSKSLATPKKVMNGGD